MNQIGESSPPRQSASPLISRRRLILAGLIGAAGGVLLALFFRPPILAFLIPIPLAVRIGGIHSPKAGAMLGAFLGLPIAAVLFSTQDAESFADVLLLFYSCGLMVGAAMGTGIGAVAAWVSRALDKGSGVVA